MSKQYKGWEIAKMISEGTLKAGDLLKTNYGSKIIKIVAHHLENQESSRELGSSFFADGSMTYEIIQQPVSVMQAMKASQEGKIIWSIVGDKKYTYYPKENKYEELVARETHGGISAYEILEGKWYVEE